MPLKKQAAIMLSVAVFLSAPGPACFEAAAQVVRGPAGARATAGAASRAGTAGLGSSRFVPGLKVLLPLSFSALGPPSVSLSARPAPALALLKGALPAQSPVPTMTPALSFAKDALAAGGPELLVEKPAVTPELPGAKTGMLPSAAAPLTKAMAPGPADGLPGRLDRVYTGNNRRAGSHGVPGEASAGSLSPGSRGRLGKSSRRFFEGAAQGAWSGFFQNNVSEHGLPFDNIQWLETNESGEAKNLGIETLPDGTIRYAPTSPTNIGYYLLAAAAAESFGWISREEALGRIRRTLKTLGQLEKWHGHLYNFYDARTMVVTSRLVSTVDSGNLAASLIAVGNLLPELRGEARALADAMDFAPLYDKDKGLLRVGAVASEEAPTHDHYGDYYSEARLAYLVAIARGDVPAEAWSRLDREGSLDGGAMDYLASLAFVDEPGLEDAVRKQMSDAETLGGLSVWGKSEAAFIEKDAAGRWKHRYGRFGANGLAAKKYGPRSVAALLEDHRTRLKAAKYPPLGTKVRFTGVGTRDVYNPTAPFKVMFHGKRVEVIAARVEPRKSEISEVMFFKKSGARWSPLAGAPVLKLQDPFVAFVDGELAVLGGVETFQGEGEGLGYRTVFYRGDTLSGLKPFTKGPDGMKDIRLASLPDGRLLVVTRPQGEIGGAGKIAMTIVDGPADLGPEAIARARVYEDLFADGEWGGANELHVLKNGMVGVLGHVAKYDAGGNRHYYPMAFMIDPATRQRTSMKILLERAQLPPGPSKRSDLKDVLFSGGLIRGEDGTAALYVGAGDAEVYRVVIPDPFAEYENSAPGGARQEKVISPYASFLALGVPGVDPGAVELNIRNLEALGLRGRGGAFLDGAQKDDESGSAIPIAQVFANHQGMTLAALTNHLKNGLIRKAFSGDEQIRKVLPLLSGGRVESVAGRKRAPRTRAMGIKTGVPEMHVFGAGNLLGAVTNFGSGFLRVSGKLVRHVGDYFVNAFRADPVEQESWGQFLYLSEADRADPARRAVWSTAYQPTKSADPGRVKAEFWPGGATLKNTQRGILSRTRIWADSAVQVHEVTLTNQSQGDRTLNLTSFQDLALQSAGAYWAHPAYQKIFVETRYDPAAEVLYGVRRGHDPGEEWPVAFFFSDTPAGQDTSFETSREAFLGKGGPRLPDALAAGRLTGMEGAVIEPAAVLQRQVSLKPGESKTVRFFTSLAADETAAREIIGKYQNLSTEGAENSRQEAIHAAEEEILAAGIAPKNRARWASVRSQLSYPRPRTVAEPSAPRGAGPSILWRVSSESEIPDALELIQLQPFWRNKGTTAEVVFLLDIEDALEKQRVTTALKAAATRILPGWNKVFLDGVRVLDAAGLTSEERYGLESRAAVLLGLSSGVRDGSLPLAAPNANAIPTGVRDGSLPLAAPDTSPLFEFDSENNEVVIFRPKDVPGVWSHVLANGYGPLKDGKTPEDGGPQYALLLTQNGGGFAARWDAQGNRTTGFTADPALDAPAMAFYLRDLETGRRFSLTSGAGGSGEAEHKVRFGQEGYAVFEAVEKEARLKASLTAFVPPDSPAAFLVVDVENLGEGPRRLDLTGLVDLALGEAPRQANRFVVVSRDPQTGALLARNPAGKFPDAAAFFGAVVGRPSSYGADRAALLGVGGDLRNPAALSSPELDASDSSSGNPMAGLRLPILDLKKHGDKARVILALGQGKDREQALKLLAGFQKEGAGGVDRALAETRSAWKKTRSAFEVSSPDAMMDPMLNGWLPRQAFKSRMEARSGYHQAGGAFGGRDQVQDSLIGLHLDPLITRNQIRLVARRQFREGDIQHWWFQFRGKESGLGVRTRFSDDLLWMPYVLAQYLDATGDESLLKEQEPYLLGRELREEERDRGFVPKTSPETGSIYEHAARAIDRSLTKIGKRGLPLMGTGDWNDGMGGVGAGGKGESIWMAFFLYDVLQRFAPVAEKQGDPARARRYLEQAASLKAAIAKHAWDGRWWLRATYDDGAPLGGVASEKWMIDNLPQAWAVISGAGAPERNREGLESAWRYLVDRKNGIIKLGAPFFAETPKDGENHPGSLAAYPPGRREHGSYTHAAVWLAISFAMMGDGDRAFELLGMLNPMVRTMTPERLAQYRQEPYAVAADRNADEPFLGRAGWTQYTGSAGWLYRAYVEYILGLRFKDGGLLIDPALPRSWDGYTAKKTLSRPVADGSGMALSEARYEITVKNPGHVSKGVKSVLVDGKALPPGVRIVPFLGDGKVHHVEVLMVDSSPDAGVFASGFSDVVKDNRLRAFVRGALPRAARAAGRSLARAAAALRARLVSGYDRGYAGLRTAFSLPYWLELYPAWVRLAYIAAPSLTEKALRWAARRGERRRAGRISDADKSYLLDVLKRSWRYYEDYGDEQYGTLPPDHIDAPGTNTPDAREGREPGRGGDVVYAPTSPTDIGYGLLATAIAQRFGSITREEAVERLTQALKTLESLPKWNGLLYNFYHARTSVAVSRFISTVDNGNLAAALTTVGNLIPEARGSAHRLRDEMNFRLLYDKEKKLLHNGFSPDTGELSSSYYDLRVSEARTAYQEAIAKGDIPPEAWFALGHQVARTPGGATFANYGGTAMEFATPLGHLDEAEFAPHIWGPVLRRFFKNQIKLARRWGLPFWGFSESGRLESGEDGEPGFGYRTHGDPETSQGHYRTNPPDKNVVAPYASVMGLSGGADPSAVVENLRRLEAHGALGPYGFWEAMHIQPDGSAAPVRQVMAHHQGMIMLAIANTLTGGEFRKAYSDDARIKRAIWPLIEERRPEAQAKPPPPTKTTAPQSRYLGLGNKTYGVAVNADGSMLSRGRGPLDGGVILARREIARVSDLKSGRSWSVRPDGRAAYQPGVVELRALQEDVLVTGRLSVDSEYPVEMLELTVENLGTRPRTLRLENPFELRVQDSAASRRPPAAFRSGGAQDITLKPGETRTLRFITGLASDPAVAERLKLRFSKPKAVETSRLKAMRGAMDKINFAGGMSAARHALWEAALAKLFAQKSARRSVLYTLSSAGDVPAALELAQLSVLWRQEGAPSRVTFVLDIKDEIEKRRAEKLLRGAATRVLPGWNAVALEGIDVLLGEDLSAKARAALSRQSGAVLP